MNDDREYWNGLAIIAGAAAALCAALLSGCATIRTMPGIGAAAVAGAAYLAGRKGRAA